MAGHVIDATIAAVPHVQLSPHDLCQPKGKASPLRVGQALLQQGLMPVPAMQNKTVGIVGAGRIGAAYARMFAEGHKMDIVYFDPYPNKCACITAWLRVLA